MFPLHTRLGAGEYEQSIETSQLSSGIYFCVLTVDGASASKKMILTRL